MTITVQDDDGATDDAVSYIGVDDFRAYHSARGASLGSSPEIEISADTISVDEDDQSFNDTGRSFLRAGLKVGDVISVDGFVDETDDNLQEVPITLLTAAKCTIGGTPGAGMVDAVAGDTVTITCSFRPYTDAQIEQALVRARDYLDSRFRYVGYKLNGNTQCTQWPRFDAYDQNEESIEGIPQAVKEAQAEYALRSLQGTVLAPDPESGGTGGKVTMQRSKVGDLEEQTQYSQEAATEMPEYPAADAKLLRAGLVYRRVTGNIRRG